MIESIRDWQVENQIFTLIEFNIIHAASDMGFLPLKLYTWGCNGERYAAKYNLGSQSCKQQSRCGWAACAASSWYTSRRCVRIYLRVKSKTNKQTSSHAQLSRAQRTSDGCVHTLAKPACAAIRLTQCQVITSMRLQPQAQQSAHDSTVACTVDGRVDGSCSNRRLS